MKNIKRLNHLSYAKINLFLDVLAKQKSGFHKIRTIFSEIALHDEVNFTLTKNPNIKILSNIDFVSTENNLIYKVAFFIQNKYNVQEGVEIHLTKNIPISAGLGGGSSNAAQTIIALSKLWKLDISAEEMHMIAEKFGSDINFFLTGGCALGTERGNVISSLDPIHLDNILLINPGFEIASRDAYNLVEISKNNNDWEKLIETTDPNYCFNKLEEGIVKRYPDIKNIIDHLNKNGVKKAMLSGSGATVIGFCPNNETAQNLSKHYSKKNFWNIITKTKKGERNGNYRC